MRFQFYRLYLLIVMVGAGLFWSFGHLYDELTTPDYNITATQLFNGWQKYDQQLFNNSDMLLSDIPPNLQKKLRSNQIILLQNDNGQHFYYKLLDGNQLLQLGPIQSSVNENLQERWLILLFYSALAVLLVVAIKPIFIDLEKLQKAAAKFSKEPGRFESNIKPSSNIYPLADTFTRMSAQISDFIDLHQDLSRTIAHEIRTPLSRMKFISEALSADIDSNHYQQLADNIREIEELVEDYLNFARLESREDIFEKTERNIKLWLDRQVRQLNDSEHVVTVELQCRDDFAFFQQKFLQRALQNLVVNAYQFASSLILVQFSINDGICRLSVEDDGQGLPPDHKDLFRAFKRKDNFSRYQGFGLGLYITRKVAIWHGGEIHCRNSKKLGGAKFILQWPNSR